MKIKSLGANKTEVVTDKIKLLISYETPVVYIDLRENLSYKVDKFYSVTTSKHINQWLTDQGYEPRDAMQLPEAFFMAILET